MIKELAIISLLAAGGLHYSQSTHPQFNVAQTADSIIKEVETELQSFMLLLKAALTNGSRNVMGTAASGSMENVASPSSFRVSPSPFSVRPVSHVTHPAEASSLRKHFAR